MHTTQPLSIHHALYYLKLDQIELSIITIENFFKISEKNLVSISTQEETFSLERITLLQSLKSAFRTKNLMRIDLLNINNRSHK